MTTPSLTDERLAWLAVRDELDRRSRRGFGQLLLRLGGARPNSSPLSITGRVSAPSSAREHRSARMMRYSLAVDRLTQTLSPDERAILRSAGTVPDWFVPRALELAKSIGF